MSLLNRLGVDLTPLRTARPGARVQRHGLMVLLAAAFWGLAGIELLSYTTGPLLGQLRSGTMARTRLGVGGSIWVGGALCIAGTIALGAALPRFFRYTEEEGQAIKRAADQARLLDEGVR